MNYNTIPSLAEELDFVGGQYHMQKSITGKIYILLHCDTKGNNHHILYISPHIRCLYQSYSRPSDCMMYFIFGQQFTLTSHRVEVHTVHLLSVFNNISFSDNLLNVTKKNLCVALFLMEHFILNGVLWY